jgi:MFS family permease
MIANMVAMLIAAPVSGALSDRFGSRIIRPIGAAITALALFQLSRLTGESSSFDIFWRLGMLGLGMGAFNAPNNSAIMGSVARESAGMAAGVMASMRNLGNVTGIAIAGTVLVNRIDVYGGAIGAAAPTNPAALIHAVSDAFLVGSIVASLALVVALTRGSRRPVVAPGAA